MPAKKASDVLQIPEPRIADLRVNIVGTTPFVCNRLSEKARRELLLPSGGRRTKASRAESLKHDPVSEFRASPYVLPEGEPTLLAIHGAAPRRALAAAALDVPGTSKAGVGRLVSVPEQYPALYGDPYIFVAIVRSADKNKTPDVRTRALVWPWAVSFTVRFIEPQLTRANVLNLLTMAGVTIGVGDGRNEKGALSYGAFRLANDDDAELRDIVGKYGRAAQEAAFEAPRAWDSESGELLEWFEGEIDRRDRRGMLEAV